MRRAPRPPPLTGPGDSRARDCDTPARRAADRRARRSSCVHYVRLAVALERRGHPLRDLLQVEGLANHGAAMMLEPGAHFCGLGIARHDCDMPLERGPPVNDGEIQREPG